MESESEKLIENRDAQIELELPDCIICHILNKSEVKI